MKAVSNTTHLVAIGNSRGIRLPRMILRKYHFTGEILLEEKPEGLLIRPKGRKAGKLSWKETYRAMAREKEDWSDFEGVVADGLEMDQA